MKSKITVITIVLLNYFGFAQQGINYKAILKDTNGNVLAGTYMTVQFTIHQTTETGTIVYQEDHNYTTDTNGLVILNIGTDTSPSIGVFDDIDWNTDLHFLQTTITYSGGTIDFDATQFMAVPYAKHAKTAGNVFSGNYNDLTNQPTIVPVTALEKITEFNGTQNQTGYRLIGSDPDLFGPIGTNAIDFSFIDGYPLQSGATGSHSLAVGGYSLASGIFSVSMGELTKATGNYSFAFGNDSEATGDFSFAAGYNSNAIGDGAVALGGSSASGNGATALGGSFASGNYSYAMGSNSSSSGSASFAMGNNARALSRSETVIGSYNSTYTLSEENGNGSTNWNPTDRLFVIGNGISNNNRSNALTVLKNGKTGIGNDTPSSLLEVAHKNGAPLSESLSILNTDTNNAWQFHTTSYLNIYRNGIFKGSWNATSGAYVQASDRRVKKDITPLDNNTLDKVMQLNPVSYLMKDQADTTRNIGLISQEVQEIFPSITHYVKDSDLLALSYTELIPILIKALQEQQVIINEHKKETESLSADNSNLKDTLNKLILRVEKIEANNQ